VRRPERIFLDRWPPYYIAIENEIPIRKFKENREIRIVNAELRWGIDLFDDLQKLQDLGTFRMAFDVWR